MSDEETIYLVKARVGGTYIWIGGEQSNNLGRARCWGFEKDAREVADSNQMKMDEEMSSITNYKNRIRFEVVPVSRKEFMVARLRGI